MYLYGAGRGDCPCTHVCVCMCVCERACVHVCVRACVCVCALLCLASVQVTFGTRHLIFFFLFFRTYLVSSFNTLKILVMFRLTHSFGWIRIQLGLQGNLRLIQVAIMEASPMEKITLVVQTNMTVQSQG